MSDEKLWQVESDGSGGLVSAHQPCYLPYLGTFAKLAACDTFVWYDVAQQEDSGFENRVRIKTDQGPKWLTVPCKRSRDLPLSDIEVDDSQGWRKKHWKTIEAAYRKAPFFEHYADTLRDFYLLNPQPMRLSALNLWLFVRVSEWLGIERPIVKASSLGIVGRKSDAVLSMSVILHAREYLFGTNGRAYCDEASFKAAKVGVRYQDYKHPVYSQLHGEFVPGLSVLDLLFNEGPSSLRILTEGQ